MCRLAEGDRSAFHLVFSRAYPLLAQFASRMLGDGPEAEDAAQQALLKIFLRAAEFDGERDALTWMFVFTAYECRTALKSRARRSEESDLPDLADEETPESALARRELYAAASEALGALSAEDVATLESAWCGGLRPPIAAATFRKRVQRALERLRAAWRIKHGAG
jgi:RNA polymerase sigma-70 factor (ECF subfamily)